MLAYPYEMGFTQVQRRTDILANFFDGQAVLRWMEIMVHCTNFPEEVGQVGSTFKPIVDCLRTLSSAHYIRPANESLYTYPLTTTQHLNSIRVCTVAINQEGFMTVIAGKERSVLIYLIWFRHRKGFTPTLEEIGHHFQMSRRTAGDHCRGLERKGFISRKARKARSIRINMFEAFA